MSPEMLPMLPMLPLDVTLQIARKTNVHGGCDRTHLNFHPSQGGNRHKPIPARKSAERLLERLGKAKTFSRRLARREWSRHRHPRKVTEAYLRRRDGVERGESGVHSNRPQRPLFPCPGIPDNLANIGLDRLSNRHKPPHCQGIVGEENAKTPENIDLSAMSAMSAVKYHSGGKNPT